jgi:SAM-dependent methyltransferase
MNNKKFLREPCLVCKKYVLQDVKGYEEMPRITSDCRPFTLGGKLAVCNCCSLVQKLPSTEWLTEINDIYHEYSAYSVAGGEEQLVLDSTAGILLKRSEVILKRLKQKIDFPKNTDLLDVGCGHGVTLREIARMFPDWALYGYELGSGKLDQLCLIDGFSNLYTGKISEINKLFDLITMIHSLEHFINPLETLKQLGKLLRPDGILFIEVCNTGENPFDLVIADHLTHFTPESLSVVLNIAGFKILECSTDWVKKEISVIAIQNNSTSFFDVSKLNSRNNFFEINYSVQWLNKIITEVKIHAATAKIFGLFGTSIAATWLATILKDSVHFFVDEDPHRIGKNYMGLPVIHPADVDVDATVFLGVAPVLSKLIMNRLGHLPFRLVTPTELPSI